MTFHISVVTARDKSLFELQTKCFCCGKAIQKAADGPVVAYDAYPGTELLRFVLMHRDCAFAMAQRIICDAWPNRRAGDKLEDGAACCWRHGLTLALEIIEYTVAGLYADELLPIWIRQKSGGQVRENCSHNW